MPLKRTESRSAIQPLMDTANVMYAVVLRDMRTRFFNHGLGFLIVPLWPLAHIGILILIHIIGKASAPFGDSTAVFYATGLIPTLTFIYVSRFMAFSLVMNRSMLNFPIVTMTDVVAGRAFLETIAAFTTLGIMIAILWATGQNPWPVEINSAVSCYLATLFLAYGIGTFIAMISVAAPILLTLYQLLAIALYLSSGTLFVANRLPPPIAYALSFNPLMQCVEWMRTSYYPSYSDQFVSKAYVLTFALVSLFAGLVINRVLRRILLEQQ